MKEHLVTLDAGHGGKDPGAVANGLVEKSLNLLTQEVVKKTLEEYVDVLCTRSTDEFVELVTRAKMANDRQAECFVSIHYNSFDDKAHGIETFNYPGSSKGNVLAQFVHKQVVKATGLTNRGVKEANFSVLRNTKMPACLVECGFLTSSIDSDAIKSEGYIDKVGKAIAYGILDYLGIHYNAEPNYKEMYENVNSKLEQIKNILK